MTGQKKYSHSTAIPVKTAGLAKLRPVKNDRLIFNPYSDERGVYTDFR
jgi:hypothetical protein